MGHFYNNNQSKREKTGANHPKERNNWQIRGTDKLKNRHYIYIYLFNIITHTVHTYSNTLIMIEHKISISVICKEFNAP